MTIPTKLVPQITQNHTKCLLLINNNNEIRLLRHFSDFSNCSGKNEGSNKEYGLDMELFGEVNSEVGHILYII